MIALLLCSLNSYAQYLDVNVLALTDASPEDEIRVNRAVELVTDIVNDENFRREILNMSYKIGNKTYKGYTQTSLTPKRILDTIIEARENFVGGQDGVMDLNMDMYYEQSTTIGYTSRTDRFFHMNRYHHQNYTPFKTAGNIFHEWLHKINHGHSQNNNEQRPHSVPYKLGYLIATKAAESMAHGDPILLKMYQENFEDGFNEDCMLH